jgi:hypothetical protein
VPDLCRKSGAEGARKGGFAIEPEPGQALFDRLKQHVDSIRQAHKYAEEHGQDDQPRIEEFLCRYLLVDDVWIPLGEAMMIERFHPIWNVVIERFGNHDLGKGRYKQQFGVGYCASGPSLGVQMRIVLQNGRADSRRSKILLRRAHMSTLSGERVRR